jgi:type 1 glutamine amidotransferase
MIVLFPAVALADDAGFIPIFDGKTLEGWDGNPAFWRVEDGAITGQTTKDNPTQGNTFIIWRQGALDDFELKLEYRIIGGNSGIQYRSFEKPDDPEWKRWVIGGYQADFEAGDTYSGILYGERFRGVLALRGQKTVIGHDHKPKEAGTIGDGKELGKVVKKEDWNAYHIVARGYHFTHAINGQLMIEATDEDKAMRLRSGLLALQLHAGPPMTVQFRNIRLKRLPMGDKKKVVLVAGAKSHGHGAHEHNAGCRLLADALNKNVPGVHASVYRSGWPKDPSAFANADAIVMYCDGGDGHMVNQHLESVDRLMKKGVGLACIHYGVEVPKGKSGDRFLDWIGGYFETHWSVNPHWTADFKQLPEHPITRGVRPFAINDEWYYHMRFRDGMENVTPILTAVPPASTLNRKDGPHSGNKHVRAKQGQPQHVAWATERADGGRGFGFTGGHVHWNWGHDDFRKLVLNAVVWVAGADVPYGGVKSVPLSVEDLEAGQDYPTPDKYDRKHIEKMLRDWTKPTAAK